MKLILPDLQITHEQFHRLVVENPDWNFEQTAAGELVIAISTGGTWGRKRFSVIGQLWAWVETHPKLGNAFDLATLFALPNGAKRSPDFSWVRAERLDSLIEKQQDRYVFLCPDFVVELRSPSEELQPLQAKMWEYLDCGAELGWLIDSTSNRVEIYRSCYMPNPKILNSPDFIYGEEVLPELKLNLTKIWQ